jgi:hypothetical protein
MSFASSDTLKNVGCIIGFKLGFEEVQTVQKIIFHIFRKFLKYIAAIDMLKNKKDPAIESLH